MRKLASFKFLSSAFRKGKYWEELWRFDLIYSINLHLLRVDSIFRTFHRHKPVKISTNIIKIYGFFEIYIVKDYSTKHIFLQVLSKCIYNIFWQQICNISFHGASSDVNKIVMEKIYLHVETKKPMWELTERLMLLATKDSFSCSCYDI